MVSNINFKPSISLNEEYTCIEYPGVIKNENKMIETLGGIDHIEKVHNDPSKRMDLRFRPGDPSCKPVCGDRTSSTSLLLRVRKFKRKNNGDKEEFAYQQHICGIVNSVYRFSTLCDYQYLSLRKPKDSNASVIMTPYLQVNSLNLEKGNAFAQDIPLFLPPPTFGRLDNPSAYLYKNEDVVTKSKPSVKKRTLPASNRKSRSHNCITINYEDEVPVTHLPGATKAFDSLSADVGNCKSDVKKAFDERPVWSRNALVSKLNIREQLVKLALPIYAYYYITGPWARLWVRFGYDPKTDPNARHYQLIDFRLRQGIHTPFIPIKPKRNTLRYKLPHLASKNYSRKTPDFTPVSQDNERNAKSGEENTITDGKNKKDILPETAYLYTPGVLPAFRHIFYQACDIHLPAAQDLVTKTVSGELKCTKEDGWFYPNTTADIRNLLSNDILKTVSTHKYGHLSDKNTGNTSSSKKDDELYAIDEDGATEEFDELQEKESESDDSLEEDNIESRLQEDLLIEDGMEVDDDDEDGVMDIHDDSSIYLYEEDLDPLFNVDEEFAGDKQQF